MFASPRRSPAGFPLTVTFGLHALLLTCFLALAQPLGFDDLPPPIQQQFNRANFPTLIEDIRRSTALREDQGENDHMIFYALQSRAFTSFPPIEPALSAQAFHNSGVIPPDAQRRLDAFASALRSHTHNERLDYFRRFAPATLPREYSRAMLFLYRKEFQNEPNLYQTRGHSTDTALAANYTVWQALSVLHALKPAFRPEHVLIIGPGLDFAPRTAFDDSAAPQSYQPFAILDALRSLNMGDPKIHCFDINDRVIGFFTSFQTLKIHAEPGDAEYRAYFTGLGKNIGKTRQQGWTKTIALAPNLPVTAEKLNILTDRPAGSYDLIIATNVLLYFNRQELLLALANISRLMTPGAIFLHNDLRPGLDTLTALAAFNPIAARTVRFSPTEYDSFALYSK